MANLGYIQLARRCNQKCVFCSNPSNGKVLTFEQAVAHVDDFVRRGYDGIILTGGEPTLFEPIAELIAYAKEKGIESRVISNGQKTARFDYLKELADAGLTHLHLSIHSHRAEVHDYLTQTPGSHKKQIASLNNAHKLGVVTDINTVINRHNADHLDAIVTWIVKTFPFVHHFVWNNMDPALNPDIDVDDLVPKLWEFEVSLYRAMRYLDVNDRTFRAERIPLCYMADYAHCSTETRKIIKNEERIVHFLDQKETVEEREWEHGKAPICANCRYNPICAGLYEMDRYYDSAELSPVFMDPEEVRRMVLDKNTPEGEAAQVTAQCGTDPSNDPS